MRRSSSFRWVLGLTSLYLGAIVLFPLGALLLELASTPWPRIAEILGDERVQSAALLSARVALAAAAIDAVLGLLVAWVLVRYDFFGRRFLDALVDLPFALPTAVAGIALTTLLGPEGWLGEPLSGLGIEVAFTPLGIVAALSFVGFPFVVRTLQPVIEDLDPEVEEAAFSLGASRVGVFRRVIWPELVPALATGTLLSFARGLGEYGSVVFISGNMPFRTELVPLLIVSQLEQYDTGGAATLAVLMLTFSFAIMLGVNALVGRRFQGARGAP